MSVNRIGILFKPSNDIGFEILPRHIEQMQKVLPQAKITRATEEAELIATGADSEVLLTWGLYTPEAFCKADKNLQWIHVLSTGVDGLLVMPELRRRGIHITSSKGTHGPTISESVLGMIICFARGLHLLRDQQHRKIWRKNPEGREIQGRTVGILGLGTVGRVVAQKLKAVDMRVLGMDLCPVDPKLVDRYYPAADLPKLLAESDYVVITLPLTPNTRHLIGEAQLRAMRKSAYLINVGRGPLVDEPALTRALKEGWIAGAALDVFETEPLPAESELWEMPNVIVSPHTSALCPENADRAVNVFCENLSRIAAGKPLQYELNWDAGF